MYRFCNFLFSFILILILAGCGARSGLAPVRESRYQSFSPSQNTHTVRRGETLYAIAFGYDTDFRRLARLNNLRPPYRLRVGQVLNVRGVSAPRRPLKPRYVPPPTYSIQQAKPPIIHSPSRFARVVSGWQWPVRGHVVTSFIPNQGKKGINIASQRGDKVYAASSGVVAYAGSGLTGYGNLIIIKHNNEYLTAYGNNAKNMVSEGQRVRAGQVIAEVGVIDHKYWGVHFEIRKMGIPVNPLNYLQKG
jgi:lipoprotein NlpD